VAAAIGWVASMAGLVLVTFVAFQWWGTGLLAAHSQARLRVQIARSMPVRGRPHERGPHQRGPAGSVPATAPVAATPAPGQPVATIDIPSIHLDMVVVQGVDASDLALGPGHYPGTPLPGEAGNVAIAGHRTTYLHPFYDLTAVRAGTQIVLTSDRGVFVYVAGPASVAPPSDVAVVGPDGADTLTLTTCNPRYSAATRLVLRASLVSSQLFIPPGAHSAPAARRPTPPPRTAPAPRSHDRVTTSPSPTLLAAVGWGAVLVGIVAIAWLWSRRAKKSGLVVLLAAVPAAAALFFFYAALSPLLPASY